MLLDIAPSQTHGLPKVEYDLPTNRSLWNGLVLVGEAPGKDEVKQGHPFVGRSGQLLNEVLVEAGIERSTCLVANVFRFQPPGNKVDHFFASKRAAATQGALLAEEWGRFGSLWCKEEFAKEINNLKTTLQAWRPPVIVALGRTPLWALTGENGLLTKIGQFLGCRLVTEARVMPTFHPSYILRGNWGKRPEWKEHFVTAVQHVAQK